MMRFGSRGMGDSLFHFILSKMCFLYMDKLLRSLMVE